MWNSEQLNWRVDRVENNWSEEQVKLIAGKIESSQRRKVESIGELNFKFGN